MAAALGAVAPVCDKPDNEHAKQHSPPSLPRVLLIERDLKLGGILNQCTHSGFGLTYFGEELSGQEYARRFTERVESSPIEVLTDTMVLDVSAYNPDNAYAPYRANTPDHANGAGGVVTVSGKTTGLARFNAKTVVLATGCRERPIGALPVAGTRPKGVYTAGAAQRMINLGGYDLGDRFVILGSGDVGMIVARELATRGKDVVAVIEKEEKCGGLARNRVNCLEKYNIPLITRATVSKVHGIGRVSGVTVKHLTTTTQQDQNDFFISCDTLITSVGLIPERELIDAFADGGVPDWLFLCGNACFVHDVVDDVTVESERVGRLAAGFNPRPYGPLPSREESCNPRPYGPPPSREGGLYRAGGPDGRICVACPKGCSVYQTTTGWAGLACGRLEPKLPEETPTPLEIKTKQQITV